MSTMHCPNCGSQLSPNISFCGNCGTKVTLCPECQSVNSGTSNMCSNCGFTFTNTNTNNYTDNTSYNNYSNNYQPQQNEECKTTKDILTAKNQQSALGNLLHSEIVSKIILFGSNVSVGFMVVSLSLGNPSLPIRYSLIVYTHFIS